MHAHPILSFLAHVLPLLSLGLLLATVNTGIPASLLRPQTFHVLTYLAGGRMLTPLPLRMVMIGNKTTAGSAVAATLVPVNDPGEVDGLFGLGSPLALMCRRAFRQAARSGGGPALFAIPLNETTTAQQQTYTVTGPATSDGNISIRIAGVWITIGFSNGQSATTIAAALSAAIMAQKQLLPVTSSPAVGVVTCVVNVKGTFGNDVKYTVESVTPSSGVTVVTAQTVAGAGALDIQSALDAMAGLEFDGVAIQTHVAGDITEISTAIASRWGSSEKKPTWYFVGEPGTQGTATPLASSANHEGAIVVNCEQSPTLPGEIATAACVCWLSRDRPNANYDGAILVVDPPPASYAFTNAEIEAGLAAGVTPLSPIVDPVTRNVTDGITKIERLVTTRTTLNSVAYGLLRDICVSRTAWYMAKQYDLAYAARFGFEANPDGVLADQDTADQIRDMVVNIDYAAQALNYIKNVDDNKKLLVVEFDASVPGRCNIDCAHSVVSPLHQAAFVHRVIVS